MIQNSSELPFRSTDTVCEKAGKCTGSPKLMGYDLLGWTGISLSSGAPFCRPGTCLNGELTLAGTTFCASSSNSSTARSDVSLIVLPSALALGE